MNRFTKDGDKPLEFILEFSEVVREENGVLVGPAINRLGAFERIYTKLEAEQEEYSQELAKLRAEGKKNSARFREIMGKKLVGSNMLAVFHAWGLE